MPRMCIDSGAGTKEIHAHPVAPPGLLSGAAGRGHLNRGFTCPTAWSCHHAISSYRSVFGCAFGRCPVLHCSKRGRSQERRQRAFPADRLPGGHAAVRDRRHRSISTCRTTVCRPSGWRCRSAACPPGWTATLIGGGQPVAAALPATNASVSLELRLDVPKDAPVGTTNLTVNAKGGAINASPPGRGHARERPAGQAHADAAACPSCAAPRSRASSISSPSRTTAARKSW